MGTDYFILQLYHERWGNRNKQHVMRKIQKEFVMEVNLDREICEPCIYGKSYRRPFGTRVNVSQAGDLMSADVCGPFDLSFTKMQSWLSLRTATPSLDMASMREKSDVKNGLKQVLANAKTLEIKIR